MPQVFCDEIRLKAGDLIGKLPAQWGGKGCAPQAGFNLNLRETDIGQQVPQFGRRILGDMLLGVRNLAKAVQA